jgi:histidinol-phosphate aminotransferase
MRTDQADSLCRKARQSGALPRSRRSFVRMDANEGPPPPEGLLRELLEASASVVTMYPEYHGLVDAASERFGIRAERILPVNGADEGIRLVIQAFLGPGDVMLTVEPTFRAYSACARMTGGSVVGIPVDGNLKADGRSLAGSASGAAVIILASPNNPTGLAVPEADIESIAASAGRALLVIDEAYADFCGQDFSRMLDRRGSVVLLRTLSKSFGVPGLRCGFVIADPQVLQAIEPYRQPYCVSSVASLVGEGLLRRDLSSVERARKATAMALELRKELGGSGFDALESDCHFFLLRLGRGRARDMAGLLREKRILVREPEPPLDDCIRVSVASRADAESFLGAILDLDRSVAG